jgi:hypothetical protein
MLKMMKSMKIIRETVEKYNKMLVKDGMAFSCDNVILTLTAMYHGNKSKVCCERGCSGLMWHTVVHWHTGCVTGLKEFGQDSN